MNDFVRRLSFWLTFVLIGAATLRAQTDTAVAGGQGLIVIGRTVIPHAAAPNVRFAKDLSPDKGARVQAFDPEAMTEADMKQTKQRIEDALNATRAGRGGRAQRDALAAQLILQGWLDEHA